MLQKAGKMSSPRSGIRYSHRFSVPFRKYVHSNKFLTKSPFGIQTKRFAAIGYHPGLDPTGSMTANRQKIGPCDYFPEKPDCQYKKSASKWDKLVEVEEFSKNLGFRNAKILEERKHMKSMGGPGTYDISEVVYKKKSCSVLNDVNFGKEPRFSKMKENSPPPGTYFPELSKTSTVLKKQITPVPMFEWDGFRDRFKGLNQNWKKAPNRYTPIDHESLEAVLKRNSKKKLPYCLFSGKRDGTSIKNHFAPPSSCTPDKYYDWQNKTGLNYLLKHPSKKRFGQFLKDQRFRVKPTLKIMMDDLATCYKDPQAPGPASYNISTDTIKTLPKNKYPFNDSMEVARKGTKWGIQPGPGRYDIKEYRCKYNDKRPSSVFASTTGRTEYRPPIYTYY